MGKLQASRLGVALAMLLCVSLTGFGGANASTVFNITGNASISGTLTIDTVVGDITAADIAVTGVSPDFIYVFDTNQLATAIQVIIGNGTVTPTSIVGLQFEDGGSLVGFTGATLDIVNLVFLCDAVSPFLCRGGLTPLGEATLTTEPAATPLPSALPLFGSVLAGAGVFGWRRRKRVLTTA